MRRISFCILHFALAISVWSPAAAQVDPQTALLERTGWTALADGHLSVAAQAFRDALAADPKNARLYLGAATAAFLDRRDADAKTALEQALQLAPSMARARALLGQVRYRTGDLAGAVREYEALVAAVPDDKQAAAALDRWRREAELHDRMQQSVGAHFTIAFEGPSEALMASEALASLDRAYWRVGDALGVYPPDPIPVVLYSVEQFRDITRSPAWAAGAYDGTIRVPMRGAIDNTAELDRVLAHEFTHALVRTLASRGVPVWLNEGLATALETGDLQWADEEVTRAGAGVPLVRLQQSFGRLTGADARLAYATSALAVRRLLQEAGGFALANLLRDLGDGVAFEAAFAHRIQRSWAEFAASLPGS